MPHSRHFNMQIEWASLILEGLFKADEDQIKLGGVKDKFFVSNNMDINQIFCILCGVFTHKATENQKLLLTL